MRQFESCTSHEIVGAQCDNVQFRFKMRQSTSNLKLSVFFLKLISPNLLTESIRDRVFGRIVIRMGLQGVYENQGHHRCDTFHTYTSCSDSNMLFELVCIAFFDKLQCQEHKLMDLTRLGQRPGECYTKWITTKKNEK